MALDKKAFYVKRLFKHYFYDELVPNHFFNEVADFTFFHNEQRNEAKNFHIVFNIKNLMSPAEYKLKKLRSAYRSV
tara:strand:+ start:1688 stop:1915 length:228 start_codon:yes stop_codon:yes gene_type:complete